MHKFIRYTHNYTIQTYNRIHTNTQDAETSAIRCSMSLSAGSSKPFPAPGVPRITPLIVLRALRNLVQ